MNTLEEKKDFRHRAQEELELFKRIVNRKPLKIEFEIDYYVLPRGKLEAHTPHLLEFFDLWRQFVTNPTTHSPPKQIDMHPFFCQHKKLVFDFNIDHTQNKFCMFVNQDEWQKFTNRYELSGPCLSVRKDQLDETDHLTSKPFSVRSNEFEICQSCRLSMLSQFEKSIVHVTKMNSKGDLWKQSNSSIALKESGSRKSARRSFSSRFSIPVSSSMTIMEFKLILMDKYHFPPPMHQRLFYQGVEMQHDIPETKTKGNEPELQTSSTRPTFSYYQVLPGSTIRAICYVDGTRAIIYL